MTTLSGIVRSYQASVRRTERDRQRNVREAARLFKEQQKLRDFDDVAAAVRNWNEYTQMLTSIHKNVSNKIDWNDILNTPKPVEPEYGTSNETSAQQLLDNFKPSILDKVFGKTKRKLETLENLIAESKLKDQKQYQIALNEYNQEVSDWEERREIAKGVLERDTKAYLEAIKYFAPFDDLSELGSKASLSFNTESVEIEIYIRSIDIIPDYELRQTSTGKLSKKKMSKSNYYELYQDYICSVVMRVAREIFAHLPIKYTVVHAVSDLLDSNTGHLEKSVILSIKIPEDTLAKLNLDRIDPSDSMCNFVHNMKFKKMSGFEEVERVP